MHLDGLINFIVKTSLAALFIFIGAAAYMFIDAVAVPKNTKENFVTDYYGIFSFEIPFETTNHYRGAQLYFDTSLNYEEMRQGATGTAASGEYTYTSEVVEQDGEKALLITAEHRCGTFYFAVTGSSDRYTIIAIKDPDTIFLLLGAA